MFDFNTVACISFGSGRIAELPKLCAQLGVSRPLIVTDAGIIEHGLLASSINAFAPAVVYSQVQADPPEQNILDAVQLAEQSNCDGVIGFGGGSSMDVAKLVAVLLAGNQSLSEIYGVEQIAIDDAVSKGRAPLIQVPTTAGTGSEATNVAIVTTGEHTKAGVVSKQLYADHIVLDPQLTLGLPAHVTAATGIDAMVHAIEAFTSKRLKNPLSDMLALQALRLMSANIQTAVKQGDNLDARSAMLQGAMLAGQAFANAPVGAVHALAYPLGGTFHIPHGLSNSLVLPHVLRFNAPNAQDLYQQLAAVIFAEQQSLSDNKKKSAADQLADYFSTLASELGLPTQLSEVGISEADLADLAEQAMLQQRLLINNPREVSYKDALAIYQQAL